MRVTDTHIYFWEGPFSNWDNCHFIDKLTGLDLKFVSSEQAFMFQKANFFKDDVCAAEIFKSTSPKEVKAIGRKIFNYDDKAWACVRLGFMIYVNYLKFSQNAYYNRILFNTENKTLVEASPYDKIWGVGLSANDDLILNENCWLGQNLLGKALMEVRELIK